MSLLTTNVAAQPSEDNRQLRKYYTRIRALENDWLKKIAALPGVVEIRVEPYALWVYKARLFTWDEIETSISPILEAAHEEEAKP